MERETLTELLAKREPPSPEGVVLHVCWDDDRIVKVTTEARARKLQDADAGLEIQQVRIY